MASDPKQPTGPSRRVVLGGTAGLLSAGLPGCIVEGDSLPIEDALAEAGIDHVIVVMMENRSFDHYLGALALEGRAVDGLTGAETNPDRDGEPVPVFPLDVHCQEDPPHGWNSSHDQFNEGRNDGFYKEHADRVGETTGREAMGYYTRNELPIHYALADAYGLPERYFCSVMSSTWPNRLYGHAGTSGGGTGNDFPATDSGLFEFKTVYKALEEVGLDWAYYYTDLPFLGLFNDHWDDNRMGFMEDFLDDAEAGKLPQFTWIDPGFLYNDDHPPHHPGLGQMFLALIHEAIARSPLWDRCLVVITYDEHGGFYDHVPPPKVEDDHAEAGFDQLGFRVPSLVIGPWVRQGVSHEVYDHASILRYVCDRFGVEPWTTRIATANSIGGMLDASRMARNEPLAPIVLPAFEVPDSELTDACFYGSILSNIPSGQPELEAFVRATRPESIQQDIPALHKRLVARAERYGLLK